MNLMLDNSIIENLFRKDEMDKQWSIILSECEEWEEEGEYEGIWAISKEASVEDGK